jgi:hypothetical protein
MSKQEAVVDSSKDTLVPASRWVRLWCFLWRAFPYIWGTLFSGIVIGTISNFFIATTDTPLSKFYIIHILTTYPLQFIIGTGLLGLLTLLSWYGCHKWDTTQYISPSQQNREHFLGRLRLRYKEEQAYSLEEVTKVTLEFVAKPDAVSKAGRKPQHITSQHQQQLPTHTSIVEVYEQANHELLILGEPGTGKSTLLLQLALYLLDLAEKDIAHPLPVKLPLSTWPEKHLPLDTWIAEQLREDYQVPLTIAQQWVNQEQVLPLLDGLDEMEEQARPACIAAINTYHQNHLHPLVVCSRYEDYSKATTSRRKRRLSLQNAIVVQPLTAQQVKEYLEQEGESLAGLRSALRSNSVLAQLAATPLLLKILILTYRDTTLQDLSSKKTQLQQQIWTDYIRHMVESKGDNQRYPLDYTRKRLAWLAWQMRKNNQYNFYLERLQPNWLTQQQERDYRVITGLFTNFSVGIVTCIVTSLVVGLGTGAPLGAVCGLLYGRFTGREAKIKPTEKLAWSWANLRSGLIFGGTGLSLGLDGGIFAEKFFKLDPAIGLRAGLGFGLVMALMLGITQLLFGKQLKDENIQAPNEGIHRSLKNGLLLLLAAGLIAGIGFGLALTPGLGLTGGLYFGVAIGFIFGLRAATQHYNLRFQLWRTQTFPWRAQHFLDDAVDRILLRRVGGGYIFTHRLLLDYLADTFENNTKTQAASSVAPIKAD